MASNMPWHPLCSHVLMQCDCTRAAVTSDSLATQSAVSNPVILYVAVPFASPRRCKTC